LSSASFKISKHKLFSAYMAVGVLCALLIAGSLWLENNNFSLRIEATGNFAGPVNTGAIVPVTTPSGGGSGSSSGSGSTSGSSGGTGANGQNNQGTDSVGGSGQEDTLPIDTGASSITDTRVTTTYTGDNQNLTEPRQALADQYRQATRQALILSFINAIIRALTGYDALAPQAAQSANQYAQSGYANPSTSISGKIASLLGLDPDQEYDSYGNLVTRDASGNIISSGQASSASSGITSDGQSNGGGSAWDSFTNSLTSTLFGTTNTTDAASNYQAYTKPRELDTMCFLGPALLGSVPEWLQKIPYAGDFLSDIFTGYVAYKTYARCGDTYGTYQYNPATEQTQFYYNPPLTTQFAETNQGLGIIVRGPYDNLQENLIDLTGRIPVLGSSLATSILLNH
jgi:uncharacterized membrane protein YgcG